LIADLVSPVGSTLTPSRGDTVLRTSSVAPGIVEAGKISLNTGASVDSL